MGFGYGIWINLENSGWYLDWGLDWDFDSDLVWNLDGDLRSGLGWISLSLRLLNGLDGSTRVVSARLVLVLPSFGFWFGLSGVGYLGHTYIRGI